MEEFMGLEFEIRDYKGRLDTNPVHSFIPTRANLMPIHGNFD
jgi:hypothetical protein